jgi:predicted kinase
MRSLIILKGLVKAEKLKWVKNNKLENYFLDIDVIRKLYCMPELIAPGKEILEKSYSSTVYQRFMEALCSRLGKGCLIVIDPEQEAGSIIELLAYIFGYTVFYVIQDIPKDYVENQAKYRIPYYPTKKKSDLIAEVGIFRNQLPKSKLKIKTYSDVLSYWDKKIKKDKQVVFIKDTDKTLHVGDVHSNIELLDKLPDFSKYVRVIFHGDYIDGPKVNGSRDMIDFICKTKNKKIIWLEGNHEIRLRRYLGYILLSASSGRKELKSFIYSALPDDFLEHTATEFSDLTTEDAKMYLDILNNKFKMFAILVSPSFKMICTHSGIRLLGQIDPRYIGTAIYGNREMNRYDKNFSDLNKNNDIWSIHAHCQYPDSWEIMRYPKVVNLDPQTDSELVYGEQSGGLWDFRVLK